MYKNPREESRGSRYRYSKINVNTQRAGSLFRARLDSDESIGHVSPAAERLRKGLRLVEMWTTLTGFQR